MVNCIQLTFCNFEFLFDKKMKPEVNKGKLVFFIVGSTLLITFVFYGYQICYTPNILLERDDRPFIIRSGSTFRQVQEELVMGLLLVILAFGGPRIRLAHALRKRCVVEPALTTLARFEFDRRQ